MFLTGEKIRVNLHEEVAASGRTSAAAAVTAAPREAVRDIATEIVGMNQGQLVL